MSYWWRAKNSLKYGSCDTYTRYSEVDDNKQNKNVLSDLNGSFLSNYFGGDHTFFNFFKGCLIKKVKETMKCVENYYSAVQIYLQCIDKFFS